MREKRYRVRAIQLAVACVAMLVATAGQVHASLISYADRPTFDAANPGLPVENFSEAAIGPSWTKGLDAAVGKAGDYCHAKGLKLVNTHAVSNSITFRCASEVPTKPQ